MQTGPFSANASFPFWYFIRDSHEVCWIVGDEPSEFEKNFAQEHYLHLLTAFKNFCGIVC